MQMRYSIALHIDNIVCSTVCHMSCATCPFVCLSLSARCSVLGECATGHRIARITHTVRLTSCTLYYFIRKSVLLIFFFFCLLRLYAVNVTDFVKTSEAKRAPLFDLIFQSSSKRMMKTCNKYGRWTTMQGQCWYGNEKSRHRRGRNLQFAIWST